MTPGTSSALDGSRALYDDFYRNEAATRFNFGLEQVVRLFRFWRALKLRTLDRTARIVLDIGCGRGWMLYYLRKYFGFSNVAGTQISRPAIEFARSRLGLTIYDMDLPDLRWPEASLDIITMWHVLEHVTDPESYVAEAHRLLKMGGSFVVEVPNLDSWSRAIAGKYWLSWDPKYHRTHFSPTTLVQLLAGAGFKVKTVHTFSLEYSAFTSVQSIVSRLTKTDQRLFRWLQTPTRSPSIIIDLVLFSLMTLPCLAVNLALYPTKRGEVLLVVAKK